MSSFLKQFPTTVAGTGTDLVVQNFSYCYSYIIYILNTRLEAMQDSLSSSTSTHSNSHTSSTAAASTARLRSPKNTARRTSHIPPHLSPSTTPSSSGDSDRDRHWNTILNHPPHTTDPPASQTHSLPLLTRHPAPRRTVAPLRSPQSRPVTNTSPRHRHQSQTMSVDKFVPPPGGGGGPPHQLHNSTPLKPFACDQCPRRFERKGHLKVG